jgi:hypothetical protein
MVTTAVGEQEDGMRTRVTIMAIVGAAGVVMAAAVVGLAALFGWWAALAAVVVVLICYLFLVRPRFARWGATPEEVDRAMPGDELLGTAPSITRAITIDARPDLIWPWLVQIGFGRAGWYSYDWIDNDGLPSADRIVPELQDLGVGDRVLMAPEMGPTVRMIDPNRHLLCAGEQDSWCLGLYPVGDGRTRLVSRWRERWPRTPATIFWLLISEPGSFIMERKMLLGIKARAERMRTASIAKV